MREVKVSVVIPVYNVEKYLAECIESVLAQTLEDIEIVLVNDGSTDKSGEICADYAKRFAQKIKYIEKENEGVSIARNTGLANACGEFVHFMDSDDTIDKTFYEVSYNIAKSENSNAVFIEKAFDKETIKEISSNTAWAVLIRREILEKNPIIRFPEHVQPAEDGLFVHKLLYVLKGRGISVNTESNYIYRKHQMGNHVTVKKDNSKMFNQIQKWLEVLAECYADCGELSFSRDTVSERQHSDIFYLARFFNREPLGRLLATNFDEQEKALLIEKFIDFYNKFINRAISRNEYLLLPLRLRVFVLTKNLCLARFVNSVQIFLFNLIPFKKLRRYLRWKWL